MKTILIVNSKDHNKKDLVSYLGERWDKMGFRRWA
jgi:hypothetical protein